MPQSVRDAHWQKWLTATRLYLFLVAAYFLLTRLCPPETPFNGPLELARALLRGQFGFVENRTWWETFHRNDRYYLVYAPMASAVLLPFAAVGGANASQPVANALFLLAASVLLWLLFRAVRALRPFADLAWLAYLFGTPVLYSVATGSVWLLIHSQGNLFLLAALLFAWHRRPWGFGVCFGLAVTCRNGLLFAAPFVLYLLWRGANTATNRKRFAAQVARFALAAAAPTLVAFTLNATITGDPWTSTYQATYRQWGSGSLY